MHKNPAWLAFLGLVGLCTLWYGVSGVLAVQHYLALSASTPLRDSHWTVDQAASDLFLPHIVYHYRVGPLSYRGEDVLHHPAARNASAAEDLINALQKEPWEIWYDPARPERSSLQKSLPIKECLSALTLFGVFVYLIWLGYSVGVRTR